MEFDSPDSSQEQVYDLINDWNTRIATFQAVFEEEMEADFEGSTVIDEANSLLEWHQLVSKSW